MGLHSLFCGLIIVDSDSGSSRWKAVETIVPGGDKGRRRGPGGALVTAGRSVALAGRRLIGLSVEGCRCQKGFVPVAL